MKLPWQNEAAKQQQALTYAVILALIAGFFFLRGFLTLIIVAMIVAFLFSPIYEWLCKKFKGNEGPAAALTLVITFLFIIIPLIIIAVVTVNQAKTMISDLSSFVSGQELAGSAQKMLDSVNQFLTNITGRTVAITQQDVTDQLAKYASNIANFILDTITSWVGSIGSIITNSILYMYIFTAVLVHKKKLIRLFQQLNPLGKETSDLYLSKSGDMIKGMVRGQFIIAVLQGFESALVLSLVGMDYFAFWALILSFLSLIPLGAGIVTIPIGIIYILFGNYWQGAVIILNHILIVSNIDNVLKPVLVPKSVRLQPALTLLAVFAGMALFGFLGIFIGPVIMILLITTIDLYLKSSEAQKPAKVKTTS